MIITLTPMLAQATALRDQLGEALKILMMFGFIFGVVLIISGALSIRRGDSDGGKMAIVAGIIIAAAPAIMLALFNVFGLGASSVSFR